MDFLVEKPGVTHAATSNGDPGVAEQMLYGPRHASMKLSARASGCWTVDGVDAGRRIAGDWPPAGQRSVKSGLCIAASRRGKQVARNQGAKRPA